MLAVLLNCLPRYPLSSLTPRCGNPYLYLPPGQLRPLVAHSLALTPASIPHINTLIELALASQNKQMQAQLHQLSNKCIQGLQNVQKVVNQLSPGHLADLDFGSLLGVLVRHPNMVDHRKCQILTQLYLNTYCHVFGFSRHLQMYESSSNADVFDLVNQVSLTKIKKVVEFNQLSLRQFIAYLRLFYRSMSSQQVMSKLAQYSIESIANRVEQDEKLTLHYIAMRMNLDLTPLPFHHLLHPSLHIHPQQPPKSTCMKLQLLSSRDMLHPSLDPISLGHWDYDHLLWVSEFSHSSPVLQSNLHTRLLELALPVDAQPSSILNYLESVQITAQQHIDLCDWLCANVQTRHEDSLCSLLLAIYERNWYPYYERFFLKVLEMSLGNFKWENQTKIYYLGHLQNVQDENIEYLRRYILNTYASYGTSRCFIPTSSYFYKILEVVNVEKFYKDLWEYTS